MNAVSERRATHSRCNRPALLVVVLTSSVAMLAPLGEHAPAVAYRIASFTNGSRFALGRYVGTSPAGAPAELGLLKDASED
jgi:hypothetical protein